MPDAGVDRALTGRGQTVNSSGTVFSSVVRGVYDAATMQLHSTSTFAFAAAAVLAICAPVGAQPSGNAVSGITVTATRAVGTESVHITGTGPASRPLEASLYATFSRDLPTVLLSRRPVATDATGRYDATLPIAPGFFRNAIVTIVVDAVPAGAGARATITVGPPNNPAPPDDIPASVR